MVRFKTDTYEYLNNVFDLQVLRESKWDWLGEVYEEIYKPTHSLSTRKSLEKHVDTCLKRLSGMLFPLSVIDRSIGTGRFFIMLLQSTQRNNVVCFGVEGDRVAYRIALVNAKLFDIPASILWCPDTKKYDIASRSKNWTYANFWNPVAEERLTKI